MGRSLGGWHRVGDDVLVWGWGFGEYPDSGSDNLAGLRGDGVLGEKLRIGVVNVRYWAYQKRQSGGRLTWLRRLRTSLDEVPLGSTEVG